MSYYDLSVQSFQTLMALAGAAGSLTLASQQQVVPYSSQGGDSAVAELSERPEYNPQPFIGPLPFSMTDTQTRTETKMKLLSPLVGSEGTTYTHYRFHPRHRKQRFSHNKFTCSKGTVTDHSCHTESSQVAQTAWYFSALINKTNLTAWHTLMPKGNYPNDDLKRQVIPNSTSTTINKITLESGNRTSTSTVAVQVHTYQHQFKLQNRNKHPVYIDIWDIVAKESTNNNSNYDPIALLNNAFPLNEGSAPYLYGSSGPLLTKEPYK